MFFCYYILYKMSSNPNDYLSYEDNRVKAISTDDYDELNVNKSIRGIIKNKWDDIKRNYIEINDEEKVINSSLEKNNMYIKQVNTENEDVRLISENYGDVSSKIEYVVYIVFNHKLENGLDKSQLILENCEALSIIEIDGTDKSIYAVILKVGKKRKFKNLTTYNHELNKARQELSLINDKLQNNEIGYSIDDKEDAEQKIKDIEGFYYYDFLNNNFELQMVDLKLSLDIDKYRHYSWSQRYVSTFPVITLYGSHVIYLEKTSPESKISINRNSVREFSELSNLSQLYDYVCESNYFGDLTSSVIVEGDDKIDTSVIGIYTVTYRVTDEASNMSRVERTIIVRDTTDPEFLN